MEPGICEPRRSDSWKEGDRTIEKAKKKKRKKKGRGEKKAEEIAHIPQGRGVARETTTRRAGPGFDKGSSGEKRDGEIERERHRRG